MHAMMYPYIVFLTCFVCLLMMGSECAPWRGFKFSVRGPQIWVLRYFQAEGAVWPKPLLKVAKTLKLPIYLYSWFGDCHTRGSYLKYVVTVDFKIWPNHLNSSITVLLSPLVKFTGHTPLCWKVMCILLLRVIWCQSCTTCIHTLSLTPQIFGALYCMFPVSLWLTAGNFPDYALLRAGFILCVFNKSSLYVFLWLIEGSKSCQE